LHNPWTRTSDGRSCISSRHSSHRIPS